MHSGLQRKEARRGSNGGWGWGTGGGGQKPKKCRPTVGHDARGLKELAEEISLFQIRSLDVTLLGLTSLFATMDEFLGAGSGLGGCRATGVGCSESKLSVRVSIISGSVVLSWCNPTFAVQDSRGLAFGFGALSSVNVAEAARC